MNVRKQMIGTTFAALFGVFLSAPLLADHFEGHVNVQVGALSPKEEKGQQVYNDNCSSCHGSNGSGTYMGPPLIHDIYNPGHHSNKAFYSAVRKGVRQHHWPYGDMPPQKQIGFSDMAALVQFIRKVQQQNGIMRREHKM